MSSFARHVLRVGAVALALLASSPRTSSAEPLETRSRLKLTPERERRLAEAVVPALKKAAGKIKGVVRDARNHPITVRTPASPDVENATELGDGTIAFVLQFEHGLGAEGFFAIVADADTNADAGASAGARLVASERWPGSGTPRGGMREGTLGGDRVLFEGDRSEGAGSAETLRVWVLRNDKLVLLGSVSAASTLLDVPDAEGKARGAARTLVASMRATLEVDRETVIAHETWELYDIGDPSGQKRLHTTKRDVTYVRKGDRIKRVGPDKPPWS